MKVSKRPLPQRPQKGLKVVHSVQFQKKKNVLDCEVKSAHRNTPRNDFCLHDLLS